MWLEPVRLALDSSPEKLDVFFRDDDAGWADSHLMALLDVFAEEQVPIDLAAIPMAMNDQLASELLKRRTGQPLGIHQHGYAHLNHETAGRKCEFGPSRSERAQFLDIGDGRRRMNEFFPHVHDPIFTPPWNRCSAATAKALKMAGFSQLSRDTSAEVIPLEGLQSLSVNVDWCRYSNDSAELGTRIAKAIQTCRPVGIMLHHAVMTDMDLEAVKQLLPQLKHNKRIEFRLMASFIQHEPTKTIECASI